MLDFVLSYTGGLAEQNEIDFYDAARAMMGFQRSLALVTHLVLNGEIIAQATALKGAQIISSAPEEGSWKVAASVAIAIFTIGSVGRDSPIGYITTSVFDYVLLNSMGFHVDYNKTFQEQYHDYLSSKKITPEKLDSLTEKVETSIADIHRPLYASQTATTGRIESIVGHSAPRKIGPDMSVLTYEYLSTNIVSDNEETIIGVVSSYNMNTFKGRIFVYTEERPIPFELNEGARSRRNIALITESLRANASGTDEHEGIIEMRGYRVESKSGRLKLVRVVAVGDGTGRDLF